MSSYVDAMYAQWRSDPSKVHASWQAYFAQVDAGVEPGLAFAAPPALSGAALPAGVGAGSAGQLAESGDTARTMHLIAAYQVSRRVRRGGGGEDVL